MITLVASLAHAAPILLTTPPTVVPGETVTLMADGASPGATVNFAYSTTLGGGPCFGPVCVDLSRPEQIGTAVADPSGLATLVISVPQPATYIGVFFQALQIDPVTIQSQTSLVGVVPPNYVGYLDGASADSTFESDADTPLPSVGWTTLSGAARIYDLSTNGVLTGQTPYDTYEVEYITSVLAEPQNTYTLHVDMGFLAALTNGVADYRIELGTSDGGVFTALGSDVGVVSYAGPFGSGYVSGTGNVTVTTDTSVDIAPLAVRFANTSSSGPGTSDYFGVDNVTLRINP